MRMKTLSRVGAVVLIIFFLDNFLLFMREVDFDMIYLVNNVWGLLWLLIIAVFVGIPIIPLIYYGFIFKEEKQVVMA